MKKKKVRKRVKREQPQCAPVWALAVPASKTSWRPRGVLKLLEKNIHGPKEQERPFPNLKRSLLDPSVVISLYSHSFRAVGCGGSWGTDRWELAESSWGGLEFCLAWLRAKRDYWVRAAPRGSAEIPELGANLTMDVIGNKNRLMYSPKLQCTAWFSMWM